jgi:hypothetical protein
MENSKREYQRYYIFVSWKTANQLNKYYRLLWRSNAVSLASTYHWIEAFESGKNSVEDDSCSGRPQETSIPENIAKVNDLISDDSHMTITVEENIFYKFYGLLVH